MLYHITKVSTRPLAFASRVLKTQSTSPTAQWTAKQILRVASRRSYGATISKTRAAAKSTTASKATQTKKATPAKKTVAAKKPAKKPVKKTVTKAKKKKPVVKKPAKKAGRKTLTKTVLKDREREKLKVLKETSLLKSEPKQPSASKWLVYCSEVRTSGNFEAFGTGKEKQQAILKEAAKRYKSLPPAEIERLNHKSQQARREQEVAYKKWISSHTPEQIRQANNARRVLNLRDNKKAAALGEPKPAVRKYNQIADDRQPKRFSTAFIMFCKDRWASGDLKGVSLPEASKLMSNEWKALSENAKKQYIQVQEADKLRMAQEKQTVFQ